MKKLTTSTLTVLFAALLTLGAATPASAAPTLPPADKPHGTAEAICEDGDGDTGTTDDVACSSYPAAEWSGAPTPTVFSETLPEGCEGGCYLTRERGGIISAVTQADANHTSNAGSSPLSTYFYSEPQVENFPLVGSETVTLIGGGTEWDTLTVVAAYGQKASDLHNIDSGDPYADKAGTFTDLVADGQAFPVTFTENSESNYTLDYIVPSITWKKTTGDTINAYGFEGRITIVLEGTSDGETYTFPAYYDFHASSPYMADVQNFALTGECSEVEEGIVCSTTSAYEISASSTYYSHTTGAATEEQPPVEEPVVEEPVVEPPVKEPVTEQPVVETPDTQQPPADKPVADEPLAETPQLAETGVDGTPLLIGSVALMFVGAGLLLAARRRNVKVN